MEDLCVACLVVAALRDFILKLCAYDEITFRLSRTAKRRFLTQFRFGVNQSRLAKKCGWLKKFIFPLFALFNHQWSITMNQAQHRFTNIVLGLLFWFKFKQRNNANYNLHLRLFHFLFFIPLQHSLNVTINKELKTWFKKPKKYSKNQDNETDRY